MPLTSPPLVTKTPIRLPADFLGTRRMTDWSGGYDQRKLEEFYGQADTAPLFWDAQNIDVYSIPGTIQLCAGVSRIGAAEGTDKEYLLYPFKAALYRLPTANFAAADVQKQTSAVGSPATWTALTNIYPGAVTPANAVVWRDQWVVAPNENLLRVMSATEVWSTIPPPGGIVTNAVQVGLAPDDRLIAWFDSQGLYAYDGAAWAKVFPTAAANLTAAKTCDLIARGAGGTIFVCRDSSDLTSMYEWFIEPTGTGFRPWLEEQSFRIWPQGCDVYAGAAYLVGRLGASGNVGVLLRKEYLADPIAVGYLDTNGATDGQSGQDWSWRCLRAVGDQLWIGGSSREDRKPALYRYYVDDQGQTLMPTVVIDDSITGPLYSIGILPYSGTGAATNERLFLSAAKGTYYKDQDNGADPTKDAPAGYIQFPDIDYGTDDKVKTGRLVEAFLLQKSAGGTVEFQYRVDPATRSAAWNSLGFATASGVYPKAMPDDNPVQRKYGTNFRVLQLRAKLTRATSGTVRDVISTLAVDVSQIRPLGSV